MNRLDARYTYVRKSQYQNGIGNSNSSDPAKSLMHRHRRWANSLLTGVALLLLVPGFAAAQGNPARPRITDRIDESRLVVLQGHTHPLARPQYDQGAAPPNLPMDRIMLVLKRSPEQQAALTDLLEQQQDKSAPNYHKWLTPDQFGQQFGPADQDIQIVTSWLTSRGFQSVKVSRGRTVVEFSGTAAQVESALHTAIHKYTVNGEDRWANANDPQIPAALAPVVSGVLSLHNFPKKPLSMRSGRKGTIKTTQGARPQINFSDGSHGLSPADFAKIYNINPATMTGAGVTIGVIARSNFNISDVQQFRGVFGVPAADPTVIVNGPDPGDLGGGDEIEAVLDATWTGAVAPNAAVKFVVSEDTNSTQGVDLSEMYIIDNNLADVMTESFSTCELGFTAPSGLNASAQIALLAEQAAAQGITYLVASGDGGPDSCDDPSTLPANPPTSVNLLASTPFTVAVGGTQFNEHGSDATYWDPNATGNESAKSYIPEDVWNESCTVAQCGTRSGLWSSGGGQSTFFAKPAWQTGVAGIPTANSRFVPDVSVAAADHDGYVLCITLSCQDQANPGFFVISGTSASAQAFGGIMALIVQQKGRQGQPNYVFYKLAAGETLASCNGSSTTTLPSNTCIFNDITAGNTTIPGGNAGFTAGVGYDETTGLGSVNVTNLIGQWNTAVIHPSKTSLTLNGGTGAITLTHGQSVSVGITVAPNPAVSGKTPVGDVSLLASTSTGQLTMQGADSFTLTTVGSSGSVTGTTTLLPGSPVVGGMPVPYNVTAHYAGDGTFLPSDSAPPVSVTVNPEASKTIANIIVTPAGTVTTSFAYGSPYLLAVNVSNAAGVQCNANAIGGPPCPTGTVTVKDGAALLDAGTFTLNSQGFFEDQPIQLSPGTHSIVATYAGDNSFTGSSNASTPDVVTVTKAATTTTASANSTFATPGTSVTLTATVNTASNGASPTGNVQFFMAGVALGAPVAAVATGGAIPAQSTATLSQVLPTGADIITAQYLLGDSNYSASAVSGPITVTVGKGTTTTTVSPSSTSVAAGATVTLTATVDSPAIGPSPTGNLQFFLGGVALGNVALVGNGASTTGQSTATLSPVLPNGVDTITAQYLVGDSNYSASAVSAPITVSVGVPGINVSPSTGPINISAPGQSGTQLITVTAANGFTGAVTLSCAVASPSGAVYPPTCSFGAPSTNFTAPNTITLSNANTSGTATITVATTPKQGAAFRPASRPRSPNLYLMSEVGAVMACIFLLGIFPRRRRGYIALAMMVLTTVAVGTGCGGSYGGGGGGGGSIAGTTVGAYTVTVTASPAGATAQTTPITVNVQ